MIMKTPNTYTIRITRSGFMSSNVSERETTGTLEELIKYFSYTLEVGQSWEREKGNKKINRNPKNIKSLITNLYNAKNNAAANGYSGYDFELI
jgi:hypothetical protein